LIFDLFYLLQTAGQTVKTLEWSEIDKGAEFMAYVHDETTTTTTTQQEVVRNIGWAPEDIMLDQDYDIMCLSGFYFETHADMNREFSAVIHYGLDLSRYKDVCRLIIRILYAISRTDDTSIKSILHSYLLGGILDRCWHMRITGVECIDCIASTIESEISAMPIPRTGHEVAHLFWHGNLSDMDPLLNCYGTCPQGHPLPFFTVLPDQDFRSAPPQEVTITTTVETRRERLIALIYGSS
jgi:hypothetical protein